ncbi:MAG: TonB-dependent receptor, partial [Myxococcota bacterium]
GGANPTYPGFYIPVPNPYIPADFRATLDPSTTSLGMRRRMPEVGNRKYDNYNETFRIVTGVKGDVMEDYHWDLFLNYGLNRQNHEISNSINLTRALETVDPQLCALNAARGCVVGNYFGAGAVQPEVADYMRYTDVQTSGYQHVSGGATVTGDIVELPAGELGFAAGVEHRDEQGFTRPSSVVVEGDSAGNGLDPTKGGYYVTEAFGELSVPLLKGVLGAEDVTLDLAARYSDYNTFGSDTTYRVGLSYAPVPDIRVRGVLSSAFRAPAISDLYGGAADSYETLSDPCSNWDAAGADPVVAANCQAQGVLPGYTQAATTGSQIRTNIGGSPDLQEERAQIITAGVVVTPTMVEGLSLTFDYYNITVDDAIDATPRQYILNQCYNTPGLASPYCARIQRGLQGEVANLQATLENIGQLKTEGFDMTANYRFDLGLVGLEGIGRLDIGWQGNYLRKYDQEIAGEAEQFAGFWQTNYGTFAKWRWIQPLTFSREDWSVTSSVRYIGAADYYLAEDYWPDSYKKVDAVTYWDLSARYNMDDWTIIAGVNNVLNTDPPFILEGGQNADPASYDFVGTYFFTNVSYKF